MTALCLCCTPADAFFAETGRRNGISIEPSVTGAGSQENEPTVFYLYDNFSCCDRDNFIIRKAEGFIPADCIRINIPLKILSHDIISTENSLDRMLTANLRIKRLLDEYEELRKKARILLKDTRLNESWLFVSAKHKQTGKTTRENLKFETDDKKIDRQIFNITRLSPVSGEINGNHEIIPENAAVPRKNIKNDVYQALIHTNNRPESMKHSSYPARPAAPGRATDELPWIFTFLLKIINYTLKNRIEIMLYMVFIALAGYIISLQARR